MELAIGPEEGISYLTDKGCSVSLLWGVLGLLSVAHWPPSTPGGLAGDRESCQGNGDSQGLWHLNTVV